MGTDFLDLFAIPYPSESVKSVSLGSDQASGLTLPRALVSIFFPLSTFLSSSSFFSPSRDSRSPHLGAVLFSQIVRFASGFPSTSSNRYGDGWNDLYEG